MVRSALLIATLVLLGGLGLMPSAAQATAGGDADPVLELYWLETCPHCHNELEWLPTLQARVPEVRVETYELSSSEANRARLAEREAELGFQASGVPVTILDGQVWVGFNDDVAEEVLAVARQAVAAEPVAAGPVAPEAGEPVVSAAEEVVELPWGTTVDVTTGPLLASTLVIAFVDGLNPCSLWAMTVLLGLVIHTGSRQRVLAVGGVFLTVTTVLYGLYMVGIYSALSVVGQQTWIRWAVAGLAAVLGLLNLKDFWWFKQGPSLAIPDKAKPGLYRRMRGVAKGDRPLPQVLGATAALAVGVSLLETPCTAGFPVIWTNLLASNEVAVVTAVTLFVVYMVVFLIDELVIFGGAVVTMRALKLQERHGRILKLVGGVVMLSIAVLMVAAPDLLLA